MLSVYAQDRQTCDSIYLKTDKLIKTDDPCLLIGTDYILAHPLFGNPDQYHQYMRFVMTWMEKTPDYTFSLNDKIMALCKDDNILLFNVYLSCLAKAAIEEKKANSDKAVKLFAEYLKRPENKVKQLSKIKKLIKDVENGQLEKYL